MVVVFFFFSESDAAKMYVITSVFSFHLAAASVLTSIDQSIVDFVLENVVIQDPLKLWRWNLFARMERIQLHRSHVT